MDTPAAARWVRSALRSAGHLLAMTFLMGTVPVHASGTVNEEVIFNGGTNNSGLNCVGLTSVDEVQSCEIDKRNLMITRDYEYLATQNMLLPSCAVPVLTDLGPSGFYIDIFTVTHYRLGYACGFYCAGVCTGPYSQKFYLSTLSICPANALRTGTTCTCIDPFSPDSAGTRCVLSCPANSSGTYPDSCACDANFKADPTMTSCVPLSTCQIDDLPPIDPAVQTYENNPNFPDTLNLTTRMKAALVCLQIAAAAGSPKVESAYRPPAYNNHLIEVWEKWMNELVENVSPDCADLKLKIMNHFKVHELLESQQPVPNSRHTRGEAIDVSINLPSANIDVFANGCHLRRPLPVTDRVHFIHQ